MNLELLMRSRNQFGIRLLAVAFGVGALTPAIILAQEAAEVPSESDTATAVGCLRTINTAEVTYASTYSKGFSATLKNLGAPPKGAKPSASASYLVDESIAGGKKSNYVFNYKAGKPDKDGKINAYTVTARPVKWAKGIRSFFTDESGVIRWTDENRAPAASDPPA